MKTLFTRYGFEIVYDKDIDQPIADGFYFTIIYPGMTGAELTKEILYYGISAIPLRDTGSKKQGLRACVSQTALDRMPALEERLNGFSSRSRDKIAPRESCIKDISLNKLKTKLNLWQTIFTIRF